MVSCDKSNDVISGVVTWYEHRSQSRIVGDLAIFSLQGIFCFYVVFAYDELMKEGKSFEKPLLFVINNLATLALNYEVEYG